MIAARSGVATLLAQFEGLRQYQHREVIIENDFILDDAFSRNM
jgi:hypothetical protein